jgi:hypothetical protein
MDNMVKPAVTGNGADHITPPMTFEGLDSLRRALERSRQGTSATGNGIDHITPPIGVNNNINNNWDRGPQPETMAKTVARLWRRYETCMARLRALCTRRTLGTDATMLKRTAAIAKLHKEADEVLDQIVFLARL